MSEIFNGVGVLGVLLIRECLILGVSISPSLLLLVVSFRGVFETLSAFVGEQIGVFPDLAGVEVYTFPSFTDGLLKNCDGENGSCFKGVSLAGEVKLHWKETP